MIKASPGLGEGGPRAGPCSMWPWGKEEEGRDPQAPGAGVPEYRLKVFSVALTFPYSN